MKILTSILVVLIVLVLIVPIGTFADQSEIVKIEQKSSIFSVNKILNIIINLVISVIIWRIIMILLDIFVFKKKNQNNKGPLS